MLSAAIGLHEQHGMTCLCCTYFLYFPVTWKEQVYWIFFSYLSLAHKRIIFFFDRQFIKKWYLTRLMA